MQNIERLVHARWMITADANQQILENHTLCIEKGIIKEIIPTAIASQKYVAQYQNNYQEHILMPGLINSHTHIGMNYFRGLGSDLALMDWLHNHMFPTEKKWLSDEFVYDASLFAMAEMIRSGTTCFNDMFYFLNATAKATLQAGLRGCIGITVIEFPTNWATTTDEYFSKGLEFYQEYKNNPFITTTFAPHAPYTVSDKSFLKIKELSTDLNLKINLHLHETQDEINGSIKEFGKRPIKRLHDLNFLSKDVLAIHAANLNAEDLEILSLTKANIIHCPESNMKLASGVCPVENLLDLGINVALGTDSVASNNDLDMLSEMKSAALVAKLSTMNPESLNAFEAIELATINGAKAIGQEQQIGSLSPGKSADFITIQANDIEMLPIYLPAAQVVYSSNRQQVTDVWVNGKQLMQNKQLLTLDENEIKNKAIYWGNKILKN